MRRGPRAVGGMGAQGGMRRRLALLLLAFAVRSTSSSGILLAE